MNHPLPSKIDIPPIETEHLTLRGHRREDLAACAAMWGDPDVVRYISSKPSSREEVWARMLRYAGHWAWLGYGYWLVEDRATGTFVGEVGLADFQREIEPSLDGMPEIGWVLSPHAHGRGYATEAVRAVLAWSDGHLGPIRTACIIHPDNGPSLRVADKCGYRELCYTTYKGTSTVVLTRG